MATSLVVLACAFVALAIAVNLARRSTELRDWTNKGLQQDDLRALSRIRRGVGGTRWDQIGRLKRRRLIFEDPWGKCRLTPKGRLVLAVRLVAPRDGSTTRAA